MCGPRGGVDRALSNAILREKIKENVQVVTHHFRQRIRRVEKCCRKPPYGPTEAPR